MLLEVKKNRLTFGSKESRLAFGSKESRLAFGSKEFLEVKKVDLLLEVKKVYSGDLNYRNFLGIILAISELLRRLNNYKVAITSWDCKNSPTMHCEPRYSQP